MTNLMTRVAHKSREIARRSKPLCIWCVSLAEHPGHTSHAVTAPSRPTRGPSMFKRFARRLTSAFRVIGALNRRARR